MALKKLTIEHTDGKVECITGAELEKYTSNMQRTITHAKLHGLDPFKDNPVTFTELAPELKLQRVYFLLIEELAKETQSGYTKTTLHAALKPMLFAFLRDNLANFKDNKFVASTSALTHTGWKAMIEQLKETAQDTFGYVFKD